MIGKRWSYLFKIWPNITIHGLLVILSVLKLFKVFSVLSLMLSDSSTIEYKLLLQILDLLFHFLILILAYDKFLSQVDNFLICKANLIVLVIWIQVLTDRMYLVHGSVLPFRCLQSFHFWVVEHHRWNYARFFWLHVSYLDFAGSQIQPINFTVSCLRGIFSRLSIVEKSLS